jgi:hypothetical protein
VAFNHYPYTFLLEGLLKQQGALVDANADGVQRVTNGSYAFIKVIAQFLLIYLFLAWQ